MKRIWWIIPLVIGLTVFVASTEAQEHQMDQSTHGSQDMGAGHERVDMDKVRCAYDGMQMKATAMVPMKQGDETLYFCNEDQMKAFQKSPKRYLKKMSIGEVHVLMNVLTMKEYMDVMKNMGMASMVKMGDPNDTHWVNVYLASGEAVEISGVAVKITTHDGKTAFRDLMYDKMMRGYTGKLSLPGSGKHKLGVLLGLPEVEMP